MKITELRKQSAKELQKLLDKTTSEWLEFQTDISSQKVSDNSQGRKLRKDIARIKTLIREKELTDE